MKYSVLLLLFLAYVPSFSQPPAYHYRLSIPDHGSGHDRLAHIEHTGFRLSQSGDSLFLLISDPYEFSQAISAGSRLTVIRNGNTLTFRKPALHRSFLRQYLRPFRQHSNKVKRIKKRAFNAVWRGKAQDLHYQKPFRIFLPGGGNPFNWYASFNKGRQVFADLTFEPLFFRPLTTIPFVREHDCRPADRWTRFQEFGSAAPDLPAIPAYSPDTVRKMRKIFSVTFPANGVTCDHASLRPILGFLDNHPEGIRKIYIHGFSSVEGDSLTNRYLMEQRAAILTKVLKRKAHLTCQVRMKENWQVFFRQAQHENWPVRSRKAWKALLSGDSVRNAMEPWLARQRSARIMLYFDEPVSGEERLITIRTDLNKAFQAYRSAPMHSPARRMALGRLLAVYGYIGDQVRNGSLPPDAPASLSLPLSSDFHYYALAAFGQCRETGVGRDELLFLLENAFRSVIVRSGRHPADKELQSELFFIQQCVFNHIDQGNLYTDDLDRFRLPESDQYLAPRLNELRFRESMGHYDRTEEQSLFARTAVTPAVCETRYYFLLKKVAQQAVGQDLRRIVSRSDWQLELDLAEFLYLQLSGWEPEKQEVLDGDFPPDKIGELLKRLEKINKNHCEDDLVYLRLMYSFKLLREGSLRQTDDKIMHPAIAYLLEYYARVANRLSENQRIELANQLTAANGYVYFNEAYLLSVYLRGWVGGTSL